MTATATDRTIITTREQLFALPTGSIIIFDGAESARLVTNLQYGTMIYVYGENSVGHDYALHKYEFPEELFVTAEVLWSPTKP